MQIEVIVPFTMPYLSAFRKGEIVTMPDKEAKELIAGKLARPVSFDASKTPEFATAAPQRKSR